MATLAHAAAPAGRPAPENEMNILLNEDQAGGRSTGEGEAMGWIDHLKCFGYTPAKIARRLKVYGVAKVDGQPYTAADVRAVLEGRG